ncbi:MAG: hypothetical protein AB7C96_01855 [Hydrogenovibrio sp.]
MCKECSFSRTLSRRIKFYKPLLSKYFQQHFLDFAEWLTERRGILFSAINLSKYFTYFYKLDSLAIKKNDLPTFKNIASVFTVAEARKYLLVTTFLHEKMIIRINHEEKEEISNWNAIDRYLNYFAKDSSFYQMINDYFLMLHAKYLSGKTALRSIRLALTPAFQLLRLCENFEIKFPTSEVIEGYLWRSSGQLAALTGFIHFLNKTNPESFINIKHIKTKLAFERPNESRKMLRQKLIGILKNYQGSSNKYRQLLLKLSIEYLHGISVPEKTLLKLNKNKDGTTIRGVFFYLPKDITEKITLSEKNTHSI